MSTPVPRRRRTGRLLLLALPALLVLGIAAPPARAVGFQGASASIVGSRCTSQASPMSWSGGYPVQGAQYADRWASGRVFVCFTKYRLSDRDPAGDYYAMVVTSHWSLSSGNRGYPARTYQFTSSNAASRDNVYSATPSFTSNLSCSSPLSYGLQLGPFSLSATPSVCKGYRVNRTAYTATRANFQSEKAGGLRTLETVYAQKVRNGTVPRFDVHVAVPTYRHYFNGLWWETGAAWRWVDWYGV